MIKLSLSRDPAWHEIMPGVRILAAPITTGLWMAARSDPGVISAAADGEAAFAVALTGYIARNTIREWSGVGDADGNPVAPSPEWVDALMAHFPAYEGFSAAVMRPWLEVIAEGNVSAPLPSGTSAGAQDIAKDAKASARNARGSKSAR